MSATTLSSTAIGSDPARGWLTRHWLFAFVTIYGVWVWLPFLAPVLMHTGWQAGGRAIYFIYAFFCHQLPERSFFLFGQMPMYPLVQIQAAGQNTINPFLPRRFVGNASMGWKVAWSDRMISFYTSVWLFGVLWWPFRRKVRPLPWWALVLLLLPIVVDGGTHAISDLAGLGNGFRDSNLWLRVLTSHALPASFYAGDSLGSFNSWMRLLTGMVAGFGLGWFSFPHVEASVA
ncbi:MAG TPA: DUF2085 domain-containing protein [Anaerolineales bacterium]